MQPSPLLGQLGGRGHERSTTNKDRGDDAGKQSCGAMRYDTLPTPAGDNVFPLEGRQAAWRFLSAPSDDRAVQPSDWLHQRRHGGPATHALVSFPLPRRNHPDAHPARRIMRVISSAAQPGGDRRSWFGRSGRFTGQSKPAESFRRGSPHYDGAIRCVGQARPSRVAPSGR
jgi:hypothetical protein